MISIIQKIKSLFFRKKKQFKKLSIKAKEKIYSNAPDAAITAIKEKFKCR